MRWAIVLLAAVVSLAGPAGRAAEDGAESVEIPLKEIWALRMPGTRDVRKLDSQVSDDETLVSLIGRALTIKSTKRAKAGPCFLVEGEDAAALENAAKVLVDGSLPIEPDSLPTKTDLSLVFYSYAAPGYVHLQSARRSSRRLTLEYRVHVHQSAEITVHFAIIPLGNLERGEFSVDIVEGESDGRESEVESKERAICDSCSFVVKE